MNDSTSSEGVVNGVEVKANERIGRHVVMVRNFRNHSICTGSAIAPDIVVTAAHCVTEAEGSRKVKARDIRVLFNVKPLASNVMLQRRVTNVVVHRGYGRPHPHSNDLALLKLTSPIPSGYRITSLVDSDFFNNKDDFKFTGIGYGQSRVSDTDNGEGTLRRTQLVGYVAETNKEFVVNQNGSSCIFFGDSGGPALVKDRRGSYRLLGVATQIRTAAFAGEDESDGTGDEDDMIVYEKPDANSPAQPTKVPTAPVLSDVVKEHAQKLLTQQNADDEADGIVDTDSETAAAAPESVDKLAQNICPDYTVYMSTVGHRDWLSRTSKILSHSK